MQMLWSPALAELLADPQDKLPAMGMGHLEHPDPQGLRMTAEDILQLGPHPIPGAQNYMQNEMVIVLYTIKE